MTNFGDSFTNLYSLSKTLRFELKPIGKTLENMREHLKYDPKLQTFLADQDIQNAYQTLKPVFDAIHEKFITESLESETAGKIDFNSYLEIYGKEEGLEPAEKLLRNTFSETYKATAEKWRESAGKNKKEKDIFKEKGYKILTEEGILDYIEKNAGQFSEIRSEADILKAIKSFEGFFTYFGGFNQNRENYYETNKEASTAVATRVVHENLPKFCDNILFFENRTEEYVGIYDYLKQLGRNLVNKEKQPLSLIQEDIFKIAYFNKCLSQKQIEKYNSLISNANSLINLYNQAKSTEVGFKKLTLFKILYKQIGCGKRDTMFFTLTHSHKADAEKARKDGKDAYSVEEILQIAANAGAKYFRKNDDEAVNTIPELLTYIKNRQTYSGFYWSKAAINTISDKYFGNWHDCKDRLKKAKVFTKASKDSEEDIAIPPVVGLNDLFKVLDETENWKTTLFRGSVTENEEKKQIINDSQTASEALIGMICKDIQDKTDSFLNKSKNILNLPDYDSKKSIESIKNWMDDALALTQMLKYFLTKPKKGAPLDSVLENAIDVILGRTGDKDVDWFKWYDAMRNFLTKKPQDDAKENKLKLNFENSKLASGWDLNKESDNYCVIFRDAEKRQFLGIIAKQKDKRGFNKIFERNNSNPLYKLGDGEVWDKMEYKLLPGPNKMLPKCLLVKSDRKKYGATDEILEIYDNGSFKKNESNFSKSNLHKLIGFYKSALKKYEDWQCFEFKFRQTSEYEDISQFYTDVEIQGYKLNFVSINKTELDKLAENGQIYLFEIKNQDSNQGKKEGHKDNLHTIYWKALFSNLANRPKLNGEAEIFYRKALPLEKMIKIKDKNNKEIIKNFRFSKEKFLFHVPLTLNFCLKNERVNDLVNKNLPTYDDIHFLGLDRGEKHLVYFSLIDKNGNLVKQGSFNIIDNHNYHDKLDALEKNRTEARKTWQAIGTIKELKAGYISQVVRKIADMALEHGAFIVLEDLNTGFKRGRQKIEKSVYQKFELALAKKLNFLVNKTAKTGELGSVTNALQLTPPVNNYGDIENRKQVGIMLYTRANYTSQTDPVTGWRKSIYLQKGSEENIKEQITGKFKDIGFDGQDYYFEYEANESIDGQTGEIKPRKWRIYSGKNGKNLDRFRGIRGKDKNEWIVEKQDIKDILDKIFAKFDKNRSLLSQIADENVELTKIAEHTAWESLRFAIDLIQQIRNTGTTKEDNDFLLSPVRDKNGNHFDSRKADKNQPNCGDANGAYNIARKGLIMNEHIKRDYKLFIADAEWDAWLTGHTVWENWIKENEKDLKKKKSS